MPEDQAHKGDQQDQSDHDQKLIEARIVAISKIGNPVKQTAEIKKLAESPEAKKLGFGIRDIKAALKKRTRQSGQPVDQRIFWKNVRKWFGKPDIRRPRSDDGRQRVVWIPGWDGLEKAFFANFNMPDENDDDDDEVPF